MAASLSATVFLPPRQYNKVPAYIRRHCLFIALATLPARAEIGVRRYCCFGLYNIRSRRNSMQVRHV